MKAKTSAVFLAVALSMAFDPVLAAERAKISNISGTAALVHPASEKPLAKMSIGQKLLDGLIHKEQPLALDSSLQDGDGLRSQDPDAVVLVECASDAAHTLSGTFDVILHIGPDGKGCRLDVRDGQASATTASDPNAMPDGNPVIQVGDVTLGAGSTMFGVSVSNGDTEAFVIDGVVHVTSTDSHAPVATLNAGQALAVKTRAVSAISETRLDYVATAYARLDVTNLPLEQRASSVIQLKSAYLTAFKNPEDPAARKALINSYSVLQTAPNAARAYQMRKHSKITELQDKKNFNKDAVIYKQQQ